jgi:argininosuccinate synthase
LIAKEQIRIAALEGAEGVSHGATGKGNDQVRFELAYQTLNPNIKVIAPWRHWDLLSRSALFDYAKTHGIPVPVSKDKPYSMDRNLFHISYEGGVLEDPWDAPHDEMFLLSTSPEKAPDKPTELEIEYENGDPVAVNGERMSPAQLLECLNRHGGENGIGRIDIVENRFVGMKSRGVYETPGGTLLQAAHRGIESITMDREVLFMRDSLIPTYAKMIYNGFWYSPERTWLQKAIDDSQRNVWGTVRLKLYKGSCTVTGRKSKKSLYDQNLATFEEGDGYRQDDAEGFIRLNALRLRLYSQTFGE